MAGRHVTRSAKRLTTWAGLTPTGFSQSATGGTIVFSLSAAGLALRPFTVVRSHLEFSFASDQNAAPEDQIGAYGIAVVFDEASAIGVTAVPTPITDIESDLWMVHQIYMSQIFIASGTSVGNVGTRYTTDSKAMRKVGNGSDVIVVAEFSGQGSGYDAFLGGRLLLKLH